MKSLWATGRHCKRGSMLFIIINVCKLHSKITGDNDKLHWTTYIHASTVLETFHTFHTVTSYFYMKLWYFYLILCSTIPPIWPEVNTVSKIGCALRNNIKMFLWKKKAQHNILEHFEILEFYFWLIFLSQWSKNFLQELKTKTIYFVTQYTLHENQTDDI